MLFRSDEFGGGFNRSRTIEEPTNITMDLYRVCLGLFAENYAGKTVRSLSISLGNLVRDSQFQIDLFDLNGWKKSELGYVMDRIRSRYGSASLLRAVSYTAAGTARHRARLVGGHKG